MIPIARRSLLRALPVLPAAAWAAGRAVTLRMGGAALHVTFESAAFALPQAALLDWVRQAARAVTVYYGRFPVPRARLQIFSHPGRGVRNGRSDGDGGAWCRISVGDRATPGDLNSDWELTHEMVHFAFPSVPRRHHWIEEGAATYVEPIARVQAGNLAAAQVWSDMLRDMHQGLPEDGDQGLDNTHTWGRTYWGGALFCLLADIGIRRNTANSEGLQDALRAINRAGGAIASEWPIERAFAIGDRATHGAVLADLYGRMRDRPAPVDLPDLWNQLGVRRQAGSVVFDPRAPLAAAREAIMAARPA